MRCINPVTITNKASISQEKMEVPCGKCIECRIHQRKEWSLRLLHEMAYHERSVFLTLTYSDENLPDDLSISKRHLQLFLKRLRKQSGRKGIKYFATGEYGESTQRPHYHAIVFGVGLQEEDKQFVKDCWRCLVLLLMVCRSLIPLLSLLLLPLSVLWLLHLLS